ncbi:hypothetical protein D778_02718 [Xanthomarina gelatinilytica]|uniref:Uncharacterized protein n=1 Tax=Xanthomarina gelatinilytica TaxID=1137281 RepID=M7MG33_9FLAO|nr:hypothetical protein [Xanthomarina gelatinilytica]EMQ95197.1 hypothetical protein D778_02718 [Xanthomarina gelatinilytica]
MKKVLLLIILIVFIGCNKDDDTNPDNSPQYNELGLQIDVKPINQDTLVVYSPTAIEIVNQVPTTNDFGTEYTINVEATNPEKIKKGNVIVDYSNGGRLWIIKNAPSSTSGRTNGITAILGSLDTFFTNAIVEVATPTNRAKNASSNPDKLESGKFKLYSGTDPLVTVNLPNISINEQSVTDGVTLSVNNNTVYVNLTNVQLYSNSSNTFNVTIPEGSLQVNNAVDMRYKYLPLSTVLVGVPVNIGSLQEFDSSIYTTIDTDIKLDIEATTNGSVNLIEPIDKELGSYTKIIPIPPYFAASIKVTLKARLTATTEAQLNITPEISTKNNFEARASYDGLFSIPTFQPEYQNVETNLANSINGDFNLNQRLEIVPEVEVYAFGLLGPKGELIAYEELNVNASIQNAPITWDTEIDLGVDYNTSLDVSIFHIDELSTSIASASGNIFNYDLFTSPETAQVTVGNNQTGQVNSVLSSPIEIEVKNSAGETVAGVPVFFETTDGSFSSDYIITDAGGVAVNTWTLSNTTGVQNATAYVKDGNGNIIQATEINLSATAESTTTVNPAHTPNPTNGATDITLNGNLSFTEGANTPTDATFKVYFDTNTNPTTVYNLDANTNTLNYANLQEGTQYYWYIETISSTNTVLATSPIWSFTTLTNTANTQPVTNPTPNDGATNLTLDGNLSFTAGANTPTDATYRLYFDTNTNPTTQFDLGSQTTYGYSNLQENTTYYWYVETISNTNTVLATSPIWSFTTDEGQVDGGTFVGNVVLQTQVQVDNFGSNNYSKIEGNLLIYNGYNSITNIDALINLTEVTGNIRLSHNFQLSDLNGFSNLTIIGGSLEISYCQLLYDIDGLSNLTTIGNGLSLNDFPLNNLNMFSNVISFNGSLLIEYTGITSLDGLENLINVNDLSLAGNSLENIDALSNLQIINGGLRIMYTMNLENINALSNVTSLNGDLILYQNLNLENVSGLSNIQAINGNVSIQNSRFVDLNWISNVDLLDGNFSSSYSDIADYCGLTNLFINGNFTGSFSISNNAYNPTQQDIIDGNCSQ